MARQRRPVWLAAIDPRLDALQSSYSRPDGLRFLPGSPLHVPRARLRDIPRLRGRCEKCGHAVASTCAPWPYAREADLEWTRWLNLLQRVPARQSIALSLYWFSNDAGPYDSWPRQDSYGRHLSNAV